MKTDLKSSLLSPQDSELANQILRSCVHCGFCNATCPTYQLLGDENEGPRGRIYQIKQLLEGKPVSVSTRHHLDHCLSCRNCETTCPSGVEYGQLLDIGRKTIEAEIPRSFTEKGFRKLLRLVLPYHRRFSFFLMLGRLFKPFLPRDIKRKIPKKLAKGQVPVGDHPRKMIMLDGCVQPALSPDINSATVRVLHKLGISVIHPKNMGCCGAVSQHLSAEDEAQAFMKRNIDAWWPDIESGAEAIVITASGCSAMVKEYGHHLRHDEDYAEKAQRVSALCKDISEIIIREEFQSLNTGTPQQISWHPPCTLQHAQKITGVVEDILTQCGYRLNRIDDAHLCCGSAGTYSLLEAEISQQLQHNKINHLMKERPELIVTGNIGCQTHLQEVSNVPVIHWIHLLDH